MTKYSELPTLDGVTPPSDGTVCRLLISLGRGETMWDEGPTRWESDGIWLFDYAVGNRLFVSWDELVLVEIPSNGDDR